MVDVKVCVKDGKNRLCFWRMWAPCSLYMYVNEVAGIPLLRPIDIEDMYIAAKSI